jgi:Trypsin-co-occurring domain 2
MAERDSSLEKDLRVPESLGASGVKPIGATADEVDGLELAAAVEAVRTQLAKAAELAEGKSLQFEVGAIDLEFMVTLTRDSQARGGVRVWVLDVGGSSGRAAQASQKVRITLTPKDMAKGGAPHITDSSVLQAPR